MQFVKFLLDSTILIKTITGKALAVTGNIKNFFVDLKLKDNWIISYIIANDDKIKPNEPIHYYDFLLKFIKSENAKLDDSNISSIYMTIHKYKADKISQKFIFDKSRVVEAIKSYCENVKRYDNLPNHLEKPFDKI